MKVLIVGILVLALGVGAVSTYLIKSFRTPEAIEQLEKEKAIPKKFVLVAARNIAVGETLKGEDLSWQAWPEEGIRPEYLMRQEGGPPEEEGELMQVYAGALVRFAVASGEPIVADKVFRREDPGFLAGVLSPGTRAATLRVTEESAVAGFIFPGDRVDVLLTHNLATQVANLLTRQGGGPTRTPETSTPPAPEVMNWTSEVVLANRRVLSVGQQVDGFDAKAKIFPTVTLEVTPKEAETLSVAVSMGKLSLSLRPLASAPQAEERPPEKAYTTDIEVSPYLNHQINKQMSDRQRQQEDALKALLRDDKPRVVAPAKPAITIFRGQTKSEEGVYR